MNALTFYQKSAPKSLGVEFVNSEVFPLLKDETQKISSLLLPNILPNKLQSFNDNQLKTVLVTGGGTFNTYLLEKLRKISDRTHCSRRKHIINFLIFAFMGVLRLRNEVNVLCSATGSSENHSGILGI